MTSDLRIAYVTCPNRETAETLATGIVSGKFAACVNIVPGLTSIYEWDDALQKDEELLLIIKTTEPKIEALCAFVRDNHPYDTPEVIALAVTGGLPAYLDWVRNGVV